jgi:cbb3-type cytochrome oxidase subunit 3
MESGGEGGGSSIGTIIMLLASIMFIGYIVYMLSATTS